jgi:ATP-dependent protease ClpP protease subunit
MDKERILATHRRMLASQLGVAVDDRTKPTKGYEVKNLSDGSAEVAIYDEIGPWGVSAVRFTDELRAINARSITLRIASPGGDVADGLAILNALRAHPATIDVVVEGWAASAASFIAMAGDTVQMAPNSMLMIHDAMTICIGNAEEMLETAALLDKHSDNIADVYSRRAGGTVAEWRQRMKETTWYTAEEAVDAGLADNVLGEAPPQKKGDEETEEPEEEGAEGGKEETPPDEEKTGTKKKPVPAAVSDPTLIEAGDSDPSVVMPTTSPFASWDLNSIRDALTAAKEATTHGS